MKEKLSAVPVSASRVKALLPKRPADANKGTFGRVMVTAGSINYIGAAYLACSGAMRVGAGLVTLAAPMSIVSIIASKLIESTYLPLTEVSAGFLSENAAKTVRDSLAGYDVLLIGCGLGRHSSTDNFIASLLLGKNGVRLPSVIDADALNALSDVPQWWRKLGDNAILTPHPGEMARLAGMSVEEVQADRLETALKMAVKWRKAVVLKGANTVIAGADGKIEISPFANAGLASAGTGDVLSGVIAGLLAQGLRPNDAAVCGVYLHGLAGEAVKERLGDAGMLASDLLPELPLAIKKIKTLRD